MGEFQKAATMADIAPGTVVCVEVAGTRVALYNLEGEIYATSPSCTHVEADLSEGFIEDDEIRSFLQDLALGFLPELLHRLLVVVAVIGLQAAGNRRP